MTNQMTHWAASPDKDYRKSMAADRAEYEESLRRKSR